ncbi:hypothetical protein BH10ACT3_BH10ACT3_04950 [soil metagenome]
MHASPSTWVTRLLWLTLPLTLGDLLADALGERSSEVALSGTIALWVCWTAALIASLVLLPVTLTLLRILAPLPVIAGVAAAIQHAPSALGWIGLATAAVVGVVALTADVGDDFVNGSSYGDERRMALRPPALLLLGPMEAAWLLTVGPIAAAVLLLGAEQWLAGVALAVIGAGTAWWGFRILSRLARRWLVFVPAGLTVVDPLALAEPTLFRRDTIVRLGPAPADTQAVDLTAGASGLIVQIDLDIPAALVPVVGRKALAESIDVHSVLIAPTRPGAMLADAEDRRIAVQRA